MITEITCALLPEPETARTGVAYFDPLGRRRAVTAILRDGVVPATLEFLDRTCIGAVEDYAGSGCGSMPVHSFSSANDGATTWRSATSRALGEVCTETGALEVTVAIEIAASEALLTARRCSLPALSRLDSLTVLEDATVPRPRLPGPLRCAPRRCAGDRPSAGVLPVRRVAGSRAAR